MDLAELTVPAERLWGGELFAEAPCLFVSASDSGKFPQKLALPPCPVVLIGEADAEGSGLFDAVVPDLESAAVILANVIAKPRTAAVTIELLRLLPSLSLEDGLAAESMAYGLLQGGREFAEWLEQRDRPAAFPDGRIAADRKDDCLTIVLDRPEADNAIDAPMRDALSDNFSLAVLDPTIRCVELRGRGRSFSLGADLAEFGTTRDPAEAHAIRRRTLPARLVAGCADKLHVHVQGACVGAGLELAAFAHRISASPRAWFQLPELAMGLLPGAGGCVSLTRRIGRQKTALLYLSGKRISARVALDWGLVDEITADDGGAHIA